MADFINDSDIPLDSPQMSQLKQAIAAWVKRTPHHSHPTLADEMQIDHVVYRPCYGLRYTTQVDRRTLEARKKPYEGEALPRRRYNHMGEINAWDHEGCMCDDFEEGQGTFVIDGSQQVKTCYSCGGKGRHTCGKCGGKGRITCPSCGGRKSSKCSTCGGRGRERRTCSNCGGTGTYFNHSTNSRQTCSHCGGSGEKIQKCSSCGGSGKRICSTCSGTGEVGCSNCSGKGYITCETCEGKGRLLHYVEMEQTVEVDYRRITYYHPVIDEEYSVLYIDPDAQGGAVVWEDAGSRIDSQQVEDGGIVSDYLDMLQEQIAELCGDDGRIMRQHLEIVRYDVYEVHYLYQGDRYALVVHEPDGQVLDDNGPIYADMMELFDKAERLAEAKKISAALKKISKAAEMDPYQYFVEIQELRKSLVEKVVGYYDYGIWPALVLVGALFYYLRLEYFRDPVVYLPFFQKQFTTYPMLSDIHLHTTPIIFILILLVTISEKSDVILRRSFGANVSSFALKVMMGFATALTMGLFAMGIMVLTEYSGLTMLADGAVLAIMKAGTWLLDLI